ncbi:STAS-domain containing protein [Gammaproteobacteria bacterium]|nr:STAS domain-containing protein [Zoogloeaceae bacterium]MCK6385305.1 STAS domain-containing protein [Rhodocyclaceae bacterium]CAG0945950.1 STAS-domain containing protein [Gammaproteobacteria bacterium]
METELNAENARAVIRLEGRFDFNRHREFRGVCDEALAAAGAREIEVDMSRVEYIDSSALGMLLMLRDNARLANKAVRLANCRGSVRQILDVANFARLFPIS